MTSPSDEKNNIDRLGVPPPDAAGRVFISHASQDSAAASRVCSSLETAGLACWMAPRDVRAGEHYAAEILNAINSCRMLVLLVSQNAINSPHVLREVERASSKRRPVLAIRLDSAELPPELEYFLSSNHWLDASGALETVLPALIEAVRGRGISRLAAEPLRGNSESTSTGHHPVASAARKPLRWALPALGIALAVVAAGAAYLVANKSSPSRPSEANPPAVAAAAAPRASIAVMPFANLTGDASKDYLGDGMAEELINALANVPGLTVPSRTSSFAYRGRNTALRQIGRDLGVGTILEGSVRSAGTTVRITAQLIDAQSDRHLWSKTYDRSFADLFKLQDDLAHEIVTAFQSIRGANLPTPETQAPPTQDVEAYSLLLQGRYEVNRASDRSTRDAVALYERAIARDPKLAIAYLGLASARALLAEVPLADVERDARRAIALDPDLVAQAQPLFASIEAKRGNWLAAERIFSALPPNSKESGVHSSYAITVLWSTGQLRKALQEYEAAVRLAPALSGPALQFAMIHSALGADMDALKYTNAAVALGADPAGRRVLQTYADLAARAGHYSDAADLMSRALPDGIQAAGGAEAVKLVYAAYGDPARKPAALAALQSLRLRLKPGDWVVKVWAMNWYTRLGKLDSAYELGDQLREQFSAQSPTNAWSWLWSPELRAFRQDPRFQAFATRLGLMEFWKQHGAPDDCDLKGGELSCH